VKLPAESGMHRIRIRIEPLKQAGSHPYSIKFEVKAQTTSKDEEIIPCGRR
jgi:hypothetical protein